MFQTKLYGSEGGMRRYHDLTLGGVIKIRSRSHRFFKWNIFL